MRIDGNLVVSNVQQTGCYLTDTGAADAYVVSFLPPILGLTPGLEVIFKAANANTGSSTLMVDGFGPAIIVKEVNQILGPGDILAGEIISVIYDGTYFQIAPTPLVNPAPFGTFLIDGGQLSWQQNYDYIVAADDYVILGTQYAAPQTAITLAAADPFNDRFDLVVSDTSNTTSVITGTPAANPQLPSYDPATQIPLYFINVQAGTTSPGCATKTAIYRENAGTPTEWAVASSNNIMMNPNSTNLPRTGSKDIEGIAAVSGNTLTFTPASPFDSTNMTQLELYIRSSGSWGTTGNGHRISVTVNNSGGQVGNPVIIPPRGDFGFDSVNTLTYQLISIDIGRFAFPSPPLITSIVFTIAGTDGTMGWHIDDISAVTNCVIPAAPTPLVFNNFLTQTGNTVQFGGPLVHSTNANTKNFIMTFQGEAVRAYSYQIFHNQSFENGTGMMSFLNKGSLVGSEPDNNNLVKLGINYTGKVYQSSPSNLNGYMNDKMGYWIGVNGTGNGSFGIAVDDTASKFDGIFFHTLDSSYTDAITLFAKAAPQTSNMLPPSGNGFEPYRVGIFHTTGQFTLPFYGVGTFLDTPAYALGVRSDGRVIEYTPGGGVNDRFGVLGEDDTATQNRNFDLGSTHFLNINSSVYSTSLLYIDTTSFQSFIAASDGGNGNSSMSLGADSGGSNVFFQLLASNNPDSVSIFGDSIAKTINLTAGSGLIFGGYGSGSFSGTPSKNICVDNGGNVIENPVGYVPYSRTLTDISNATTSLEFLDISSTSGFPAFKTGDRIIIKYIVEISSSTWTIGTAYGGGSALSTINGSTAAIFEITVQWLWSNSTDGHYSQIIIADSGNSSIYRANFNSLNMNSFDVNLQVTSDTIGSVVVKYVVTDFIIA